VKLEIEANIHVHHHPDSEVVSLLKTILEKEKATMATLADIKAKVDAEKTVEDSIVTLLTSVSQQLKDAIASNDPAAMQAIADELDANTAALSAAVTANTPAAPVEPTV